MPKIQPPGTSMLPVMAGIIDSARIVWIVLGVCSIAQPHSSIAGLTVANRRAAARILSAGTQVMGSAHSGVNLWTCSASSLNPCVYFSQKS